MNQTTVKLVKQPMLRSGHHVVESGSPADDNPISERERESRSRLIGFVTAIALLVSGAITFSILTGLTPLQPTRNVVLTAIVVNGILATVLLYLISKEVIRLLRYRRRGRAAARLHIRIIGLFSLVAAIPAIIVAIIAAITLDQGLDRWFESRTKSIVESSVSIARAYMNESTRVLMSNTISMASELDRNRQLFNLDRRGFENLMTLHAKGRGLLGATLVREDQSVVVKADIPTDRELPPVHEDAIQTAKAGDPVQIPSGNTNLVGAVFKLREIPNAYLYTMIAVQPAVVNALNETVVNSAQYQGLEQNRLPFQIAYAILYTSVVLMVLLAAIWMGISVADRFVSPIRRLITAADEVSAGNLNVAVATQHAEGDLRSLSDTFNVMISELRSQRDEILEATEVIDQRARFTEAVLSGVSASVIGVDSQGVITIANRAAKPLLGLPDDVNIEPVKLRDISEDLAVVLSNAERSRKHEHYEQVTLYIDGRERTLSVTVTREQEESPDHSFVISVDDITDLVSAQRNTAWADVARRIAHEIKNPLTPIQLSAERIRRRYGKQIATDREVFDQCTDTIIRQVADIGRMVDEFSSFARMPKPVMEIGNLAETIREAAFMQSVGYPDISFKTDLAEGKLSATFDPRLLSQALINVIKNAAEAIEAQEFGEGEKGQIEIKTDVQSDWVHIDVIDNGKGLPTENRQRLLEPYMTTREKGTGLGLAIVRKIMEDHGGTIELMDAPAVADGGRGALMRLAIPRAKAALLVDEDNSGKINGADDDVFGDGDLQQHENRKA